MKEETTNFLDELIAEAEVNELKQTLAYFDLIVMEIAKLEKEISHTFIQADEEAAIIHGWALKHNSILQERGNLLRLKLESFIRKEEKKTIDLPNGTLKIRKMPDKVEISDMDLFLANANEYTITLIPESVKADLSKIKQYIKGSGRTPEGVTMIEGKEEFKLTIKSKEIS